MNVNSEYAAGVLNALAKATQVMQHLSRQVAQDAVKIQAAAASGVTNPTAVMFLGRDVTALAVSQGKVEALALAAGNLDGVGDDEIGAALTDPLIWFRFPTLLPN